MNNWQNLTTVDGIDNIMEASHQRPQLIFKHSTTCGISSQIYYRLQDAQDSLEEVSDVHYLDLLAYRPVSNQVAEKTGVPHQSPQVILLIDGQPVYNASHFSIEAKRILTAVSKQQAS